MPEVLPDIGDMQSISGDDNNSYGPLRSTGLGVIEQELPYPIVGRLNSKFYPLNPDQPPCSYYMKTGTCRFGPSCRFNHPEDQSMRLNAAGYPLHPEESDCVEFTSTGVCQFGAICKFNHPEGVATKSALEIATKGLGGMQNESRGASAPTQNESGGTSAPASAASELNSSGLPIRSNQLPCAFYLRTGTCRFGSTCKFDHPEGAGNNSNAKASDNLYIKGLPPNITDDLLKQIFGAYGTVVSTKVMPPRSPDMKESVACVRMVDVEQATWIVQNLNGNIPVGLETPVMVKYADGGVYSVAPNLNSLGYPLRPGSTVCMFYLRNGMCKFGATCKNDHPELGSGAHTTAQLALLDTSTAMPQQPDSEGTRRHGWDIPGTTSSTNDLT